ncbi:MAG: o-succinylbenzoate synthase [Bacteroidales bacterium]|nr:o-succinylbenzoate synthase [Bacteroidales bacterium]MDT8432045.1 o-succinylbenzoate synthase [Bacteroidales bacterium]
MILAENIKHTLHFHFAAGTSRGVLHQKDSWFILLRDQDDPGRTGIGECSLIPGLSPDPVAAVPGKLEQVCTRLEHNIPVDEGDLEGFPAIRFALETARRDLETGGKRLLFPGDFTNGSKGIPINGLVWMGDKQTMLQQVAGKIDEGFRVLKMKVGAIGFPEELEIIRQLRATFSPADLEIRLDANGAWEKEEALGKLKTLSEFGIHSVEQPVKAGQWETMAEICSTSSIPVALDEELIGISDPAQQHLLLEKTRPAYIILKPSLVGGITASATWISIAEKLGIGWWVTSALESNIGLNAIAQWTATLDAGLPQGLGTGKLFTNNIPSPLEIRGGELYYNPGQAWDTSIIKTNN